MDSPLRLSGRTFRRRVLQAAAALLCCLVIAPSAFAAEPSGGSMKEVVVTKTPYNTTIQAVIEGTIENYNSFKMDDPFRIVVDVFGVAKGATVASDIPVDTPQVKSVKISSQDGRIRMIVETPDGKALPFMANAYEGGLSFCPSAEAARIKSPAPTASRIRTEKRRRAPASWGLILKIFPMSQMWLLQPRDRRTTRFQGPETT